MAPLSVFVIAFNEADRIGRTLDAASCLTDDIVVVDSGSTDGTPDIARRHGARVIHRAFDGYGPQKRFAEEQCRHDWLLNLDADEAPQPDLLAAIRRLFEAGPPLPCYRLRIVTVYPGARRPRPLAYAITPVRLYDRRRARYSPSLTDDRVEAGGLASATLPGEVWHFSFRSLDHIGRKLGAYADLQAREKAGRRSAVLLRLRLLAEMPAQFVKYYLLRRHLFGGRMGLRYALEHARAKRRRIARFLNVRAGSGEP
jgi:glycosyltransferase involved in cell wall biosynthesis